MAQPPPWLVALGLFLLSRRGASSGVREPDRGGDGPPAPPAPSMLPFVFSRPVPDDERLVMSGGWGRPRPRRDPPIHRACDFSMPVGTAVLALADGEVFKAERRNRSDAGRWVGVAHVDGLTSRYLHLEDVVAREGPIARGDLVGFSGNTGDSAGPHLHISLYCPSHLLVDVVAAVGVPDGTFGPDTSFGVPIPGEPWIPVDDYLARVRTEARRFAIPLWRDIVRLPDVT